ncbi:prenyltransferase/squalene oxidase repeat-containing protein [Allorhodopirellula heiligendammensis]|uniref:Squalene cyclase C-terminal domain-containing protein n=1 Tax=Allorhodopirellula heiligendammensis TaxID=2714739 RepID=A0A5C6C694_9BACT|nr:prenyltransferase/squalene oxidase repeat-containing protein [Allorhodopirellula heiligendammensis]TWU19678.1 hypothetical protein Poly21_18530 [Allorhodopirellula heiligendammensis]
MSTENAAIANRDEEPARRAYHLNVVKQQIDEAPSWLVSLIVHVVLLLTLALMSAAPGVVGRIELTLQQDVDESTSDLAEFSIEPIELERPPSNELTESEVELETLAFAPQVELVSVVPRLETLDHWHPHVEIKFAEPTVSNMFRGRTGAMKQKLLKEAGGTATTEDAVLMGLEWLRHNQLSDGSWSLRGPYADGARNENRVGATAMAMLAFMGSGSTHRGGKYQKELWRAVRWLVQKQDSQGFMALDAAPHERMYAQAQGMIALCELYAMTGDSWIRPYAQSAVDFAAKSQSPTGGWRYQPRFDSDTSVTGWFVVGLKSGEAAGLEVDRYVWPKVETYLDSVSANRQNDYYAVGYSYKVGDARSPSMTAEGLLCRQYMGWRRNAPAMGHGLNTLAANHPIDVGQPDVYYWYYATQALHHFGGPLWTQWNEQLKVVLPARQIIRGKERGSWPPHNDAWGRHAGRLYTTCFSIYCLEVYYRHMPIYNHVPAGSTVGT